MADINSIKIGKKDILLTLKISMDEYKLIDNSLKNLLIIPSDTNFLTQNLTTGELGNSRRMMLPKKVLKKYDRLYLQKKIPGRIFEINNRVFVIAELKKE